MKPVHTNEKERHDRGETVVAQSVPDSTISEGVAEILDEAISSGLLFYAAQLFKHRHKRECDGCPWIFDISSADFADGRLTAATSLGDLHLSCAKSGNFFNGFFPVHSAYCNRNSAICKKANRFYLSVS